jgi:hypothetical protein
LVGKKARLLAGFSILFFEEFSFAHVVGYLGVKFAASIFCVI